MCVTLQSQTTLVVKLYSICPVDGKQANSVDLDQTPCSATSDLSLHCLPGTLGKYCLSSYVIRFKNCLENFLVSGRFMKIITCYIY